MNYDEKPWIQACYALLIRLALNFPDIVTPSVFTDLYHGYEVRVNFFSFTPLSIPERREGEVVGHINYQL